MTMISAALGRDYARIAELDPQIEAAFLGARDDLVMAAQAVSRAASRSPGGGSTPNVVVRARMSTHIPKGRQCNQGGIGR